MPLPSNRPKPLHLPVLCPDDDERVVSVLDDRARHVIDERVAQAAIGVGDLPVDKKKFWSVFFALGAGLSVISSLLMLLLG